jgi:hypothetical protein
LFGSFVLVIVNDGDFPTCFGDDDVDEVECEPRKAVSVGDNNFSDSAL